MHLTTRRAQRLTQASTLACRTLIESLEDRRLMSFSPAVSYAVGTAPQDVVAADFNGDGRLDLAATNYSANNVSVLLGNAGGTFQAAVSSPTGPGPQSVAVGDFNADGKLDLATSNTNDVSVLLGNGNGTFAAPSGIDLTGGPAGVAVGDFNADGKLDLAAASNIYYPGWSGYYGGYPGWWNGRISVLLGNGAGSFDAPSTVTVSSLNTVASVAVADFNGDGKLDVATADTGYWYGNGHVVVGFGSDAGAIASVSHLASSSWNGPQSVTAGDVNGDGKPDLVSVNTYENVVDVLLGSGTGTFAAPQDYATGSSPVAVELGDFNGDGDVDLMTANSGDGSLSVLFGAGSGIFRPPTHFAVGSQPRNVAIGDFNGDARPDAAPVNSGSNNVSVLLNDGAWPSADAPLITIGDATVTEGNSGTINATLTVSLSKASTQTVTVKYATADGTATVVGNDYVAVPATLLTFTPGQTSKTITMQVKGDQAAEFTESFSVVLSEATNAFLSDTTGAVTILDNEPSITIDDVSAAEGNAGTKTFTFTLHLSAASDAPVSANYSTAEGDTDYWPYNPYSYYYGPQAATPGSDFVAKSGTVAFAAGETSKTVTVVVNGDRTGESDEAFSLDLTNASGAHLVDDHAVGTIFNDDPFVYVSGGSVTEGNTGTTLLPFTITLSSATDVAVTVDYATADGTATIAGSDYVAKSGSVTFAAGETSKTVNVTVNGDGTGESNEYVQLVLGTVTNAGLGTGQAIGYIVDDDIKGISINNVSITEGNNGSTKLMTFTVTLSSAATEPVTVSYSTQNGTAKSGKDYTAKSGTITFAAGQTSKTITVSIKGDKQRESNEILYVVLSNPSSNAFIQDGWGEGTILNDD